MVTRSWRAQDLFTAAAIALVLFMSMLSQIWVIVLAAALAIVGLVVFPDTRRLGLVALASGIVVALAASVVIALGR